MGQRAATSQLRRGQNVWRSRSASRLPPQSLLFPGQAQGSRCCGQWHLGGRCGSCRRWGFWPCTRLKPVAPASLLPQAAACDGVWRPEGPRLQDEQTCMCVWGKGLGATPAGALLQPQVGPSMPCTDPSRSSPPLQGVFPAAVPEFCMRVHCSVT